VDAAATAVWKEPKERDIGAEPERCDNDRIMKRGDLKPQTVDLYHLLVDRVQDYAIFALDPQGTILSWNVGAERLKGYTADEVIGKSFSIFYPPEDIAAGKPVRKLAIAAREGRVEDEGWRVRKDGTRFWASVLITALRDEEGELIGYAKVTRDLTERRAADEAIRASEERFRLLTQSVRDYAIYMVDPSGHVATWNLGAQRIKGYTAEEIIGQHISRFYTPEDLAAGKLEQELNTALTSGQYEEEVWRVRKDGTRFWASVVVTPVYDSQGHFAGYAKVTRDLTERRAAQERAIENARRLATEEAARSAAEQRAAELRDLTEQLRIQSAELERRSHEAETANRAKAEFLAAMSHELRTPLNAIGGYTQLLQMGVSGPITPEQRDHLERIQRSQQHLLGIINDILNFSRIEAGKITYDIHPFPLQEALDAVAPMVSLQARAKHLELQITSCSPSIMALADLPKVEQILVNLLSNAVKFTNEGGKIELTCGADDKRVWIDVRDSGIGIPADQLDSIFAPFVQVGRTLAKPVEGAGLGLAISRDLARALGGDLNVDSQEGAGSTFRLSLPRARTS
jgi:PAS domain S-box-containing protein